MRTLRITGGLLVAAALSGCAGDDAATEPRITLFPVALAARGDQVDPTTLTPPLDPSIYPTCVRQGTGIVCDGQQADTYHDLSPGPDFACGDRLILVTGFQAKTLRAVNDAEGRRLEVRDHGSFDETWYLAGTTGPTLDVQGRWNDLRVYGTPGDLSTRTLTITGNEVSATAPGHGDVFRNTGITRFDPEGGVTSQAGPHDFYTNFDGAIAAACEILEGGVQ